MKPKTTFIRGLTLALLLAVTLVAASGARAHGAGTYPSQSSSAKRRPGKWQQEARDDRDH